MKRLAYCQSVTLMFRSFATLVCLTTLGVGRYTNIGICGFQRYYPLDQHRS